PGAKKVEEDSVYVSRTLPHRVGIPTWREEASAKRKQLPTSLWKRNIMRNSPDKRRSAYTLMEITLALAIAMMLLGAMYYSFSLFIRETQMGRQIVNEADEVRTVFAKLNDDISSQLGPLDTRTAQLPQS